MSLGDSLERPSKRTKMNHEQSQDIDRSSRTGPKAKGKYRAQKARGSNQSAAESSSRQRATISASGIHSDDVGILVTSDKGQERKCLQELSDLLEEYVEQDIRPTDQVNPPEGSHDGADIEADILAELDSLRPKQASTTASAQKLSLVTLDIPCVSFVRFPSNPAPTTTLDPVEIVRQICASASHKDSPGPRSRYIKRLTPVSLVRKTLSDGLENLCEQILPPHFLIKPDLATTEPRPEVDGEPSSPSRTFKFAIRPTIRNNNKIDRDHVIRVVADKITALGQGKHTVDLKGYEKLVLVDVYRNIVGMSVVGNEYESLKRFNLAEIHASHFADDKEEKTGGGESGP